MLNIRTGIHKLLVRIAIREDPDPTDIGLFHMYRPLRQATSVRNFKKSTVPLIFPITCPEHCVCWGMQVLPLCYWEPVIMGTQATSEHPDEMLQSL